MNYQPSMNPKGSNIYSTMMKQQISVNPKGSNVYSNRNITMYHVRPLRGRMDIGVGICNFYKYATSSMSGNYSEFPNNSIQL